LFRPDQSITRGEAAKILARAINLQDTNSGSLAGIPARSSFDDVMTRSVFAPYIEVLKDKKIIS
jgi:S-layer homology domain